MKIFMIGGTGLLGSEGAKELIKRGHRLTSLALPPIPSGAQLPEEMALDFGNYLTLSDEEIRHYLTGCQGFIFAAGIDERVEGPAPIYDLFYKFNIGPLKRWMAIAKECGVKHVVVLGSYFNYFNRTQPELDLAKQHPYIRSRADQADLVLSYAKDEMNVAVLELPYIFGSQPGRKPVWTFLVDYIRKMKVVTMYPKGGTAMITVKQAGQCIAGALENNVGGNNYPVGYDNMTWVEMLTIFHKHIGTPNKKVVTIPNFVNKIAMSFLVKEQKKKNIEGGLNMVEFSRLMTSNLFIDKTIIVEALGVGADDMDLAIGSSVRLCTEILDGKKSAIDMRGE